MSQICDALDAYHSASGDKLPKLYIVYKECGKWMGKYDKRVLPQNADEQRKYAAVARLRNDLYLELDRLTKGALGRYDTKKLGGQKDPLPKQLETGYDLERKTYLSQNKATAPYSASKISVLRAVANTRGKIAAVTEKQFEELGKETDVRMYFCNKAQRLKLLADYDPVQGWVDIDGKQLSNDNPSYGLGAFDDSMMYAMDRYGNLFVGYSNEAYGNKVLGVKASPGGVQEEKARVQSTRRADEPFLFLRRQGSHFCGNDLLLEGQLIHIDNVSGHYKPTPQNLFLAVSILVNHY